MVSNCSLVLAGPVWRARKEDYASEPSLVFRQQRGVPVFDVQEELFRNGGGGERMNYDIDHGINQLLEVKLGGRAKRV